MTIELNLTHLREEIDSIDSQILALVARRVGLVMKIGQHKRQQGLPIYDAERERSVIQRLMRNAPADLDPQVVRRVFERIIDESRGIEQHSVAPKGS